MDALPPVILEKGQEYLDLVINYAPKIVIALLVFLIGRFIVRKLAKTTETGLRRLPNLDETLIRFIVSMLLMIGMVAVIIAAMTAHNVELLVPNGAAFGNTIKNFYAFGTRRLDLDFGVSYDADLNTAIKAIMSIAEGHPKILQDPAPWAKVVSLDDSAVTIQLRAWLDAKDYRGVKMDMFYAAKRALTKASIEIPYPHAVIIQKEEA